MRWAHPSFGLTLIRLLERENEHVARTPLATLSGDYATVYYADLAVTVAQMHDPRAIKALIPVIGTGDVVMSGVAALGETAVPDLILALDSLTFKVRVAAALTLRKIVAGGSPAPVSDSTRQQIRAAFLRVIQSSDDAFLRRAAVLGLGYFDGDDLRREMERLAASDPTAIRMGDERPSVYIVREAAAEWLANHPVRP